MKEFKRIGTYTLEIKFSDKKELEKFRDNGRFDSEVREAVRRALKKARLGYESIASGFDIK